jgi:hypothetical protein
MPIEARKRLLGQLFQRQYFFQQQGFTRQKVARIVRAHSVEQTL